MRLIAIISMLCCAALPHLAAAQNTRVSGRVTDAATGAPLPAVNVTLPGTSAGVSTDSTGFYSLESADSAATVLVSCVGYASRSRAITPRSNNSADFALEPLDITLEGLTVTPGANPALALMDSVRRRRSLNDPREAFDSYICRAYTRSELGISNVRGRFRSRRMQRNFGFIFDHMDTSRLTGRTYLPAMLAETSADLYHSRRPALAREVIRASRVTGVDDSFAVARFSGATFGKTDFYDNFLDIFNTRFAGPLTEEFYDYYLVDSLRAEGRKTYVVSFHPRHLITPVLDGRMEIDSASSSLRSVTASMPRGCGVNWIGRLQLSSESRPAEGGGWFRSCDRMTVEFTPAVSDSSRMRSFLGLREITYDSVRLGAAIPADVLGRDNDVVLAEGSTSLPDESLWEQLRPRPLSRRERGIVTMVDSVKQAPMYRTLYTLVNTLIVGYWNTRYVGFGPTYSLIGFNNLEGLRLQAGIRTTNDFSRRVRLTLYGAYGMRDRKFKGGGSVESIFGRDLTRKLTLSARHDVQQLGTGQTVMAESNIFSSALSRGGNRLSTVDRVSAEYEHEWRWGASLFTGIRARRIASNAYVPMVRPGGAPVAWVGDMSLHGGVRLSWNEKIYRMAFDKQSLGTDSPVVTFEAAAGVSLLPGAGRRPYGRLEGAVDYKLKLPPAGYTLLGLRAGHILGRVPYPLLKLHEGNGTYFYDRYSFSCMNFYEFASDTWSGWYVEHHLGGALLGCIPLLRALQLREVFTCKGVWGRLSGRNHADNPLLALPEGMSSVRTPYIEAGAGVENIFRLFRVDCLWRLTHRHALPARRGQNFAVNLCVQVGF